MSFEVEHACSDDGVRVIGADMPLDTTRSPIEPLLHAFRRLAARRDDVRLVLAGRRCPNEIYSVFNELDRHGLTDRASFLPYYERCERFPLKKPDCDVWVSRHTPAAAITPDYLEARLESGDADRPKHALFFTSFHPAKQEGNSTLMRRWLDHLKRTGYRVHLVYYMYDINAVDADMRRWALRSFDIYREVPVESRLTGANYNGLNVHVDDWCGVEAMDAVAELCARHEYDVAITNYPWMSAVFDRVHEYTRKILLTHDSFVDRNRRMLQQGYPESGWISIDHEGERLACQRSDVVVAMQEQEAEGFRAMVDPERVRVIGPIFDRVETAFPTPGEKLRIGYFGSSNWVNEQNLGEYLRHWARDEDLRQRSEIIIGGGVCETLRNFVPASLLQRVSPTMVGRVQDPRDFFERCDLIINPERGGTGIKIKTLEAMAHGCAVITTSGGSVGLDSDSPYHAAGDFEQLAQLTRDFLDNPQRVETMRSTCSELYDSYVRTQRERMNELLGAIPEPAPEAGSDIDAESAPGEAGRSSPAPTPVPELPAALRRRPLRVPRYVRENAADYQLEEFERMFERIDIRGKRVLEVGSDYHLVSARMFMANGADSVVATNIGDWRSDEPLPDRVEFRACDASDLDMPDHSFDLIYGIAIVEHVPDFDRLCKTLSRLLKPDGVVYFQGCPMWPGTLGHHVWYTPDMDEQYEEVFSIGGGKKSLQIKYSFTDNNPIPDWAHVAMSPDELARLLVEQKGIPPADAEGIVGYVYNLDGTMSGSCSNFASASEVLATLSEYFQVQAERIWVDRPPNEYFHKAREKYSEEDLRTLGLRVWMTHKGVSLPEVTGASATPLVSVIIPFYGVEAFIEDCIKSVLAQDHEQMEIIFVDDRSPDNARGIVERYMARDERITLLTHDENQGLGPARNTGVRHASGDYLLFLDSDDIFASPRAVSTLVREAEASGCPVVVGSCDRLMADGRRLQFDRDFDRTHNGKPGEIISGEEAFLGASFIPGGHYVPMRAWGTLIDRFTYLDSGLEYPPAEHEDLPHTPFLYYFAERVLYIPDIVVTYRDRSDSISNTGWTAAKIRRQGLIWDCIKANIERFGLERHMSNSAVKTVEHLVMKLRQNGIRRGSENAAIETIEHILADITPDLNRDLLFYTLDSLRSVLNFNRYDHDHYRRITARIPNEHLVAYYRHRLSNPPPAIAPIPIHDDPVTDARAEAEPTKNERIEDHASFARRTRNEQRVEALLATYREHAPDSLAAVPSMLSEGDLAVYFQAGRGFRFRGAIVDAGCFVGATTMSLVQGVLSNPRLDEHRDMLPGLIRVYDRFEIEDGYILEHLRRNYPDRRFDAQGSFLDLFEENLREHMDMLSVRRGDVTQLDYSDEQPIEVLGVHLCKAPSVTDHVVRTFFPRLLPDALVIQPDFIHQYHPHIHLSMLLLQDYFEPVHELRWGGTVSFRLQRPVTAELIRERLGDTLQDWYHQTQRNEKLLRGLIDRLCYDENRWIMLQVLAVYLASVGEHARADEVYHEARRTYPQYDIPEAVRHLTKNGVMTP